MKNKFLTATFLLMIQLLSAQTIISQKDKYEEITKNTMDGTKYGIKDKLTGQEIIPASYDKVVDLTEGKFAVIKDSKVGVIDSTGKTIISPQYSDINTYNEGRTFVFNGKKWAMVDDKGKLLTQFIYDAELGYQEGVARVIIGDKTKYLNSQGATILTVKCDESFDCTEGLLLIYAASWESTGYDVVTTQGGKEVSRQNIGVSGRMPIIFNKKGAVIYKGEQDEKVQLVPLGGKIIVLMEYISSFNRECNKVIDNTGKVIIPYDKAYFLTLSNNWISIFTTEVVDGLYQNRCGILSFTGQILLKPNFSSISDYTYNNNQLAKVTFPNGGYFYIDKTAKCIEFDNQKCPE